MSGSAFRKCQVFSLAKGVFPDGQLDTISSLLHCRSKNFLYSLLHFFCFTAFVVSEPLYLCKLTGTDVRIALGFYSVQQSVFLFNMIHCRFFTVQQ